MNGTRILAALVALLLAAPAVLAEQGDWKEIGEDDAVKVWRLEVPGQPLPGFRGETIVNAPAEAVLAQVRDVESHTEWMDRCAEARRIEDIDENNRIVYNRTDSPWPAWDRDVVVRTTISQEEDGRVLKLSFQNVTEDFVPLKDGVVRMPQLKGGYTMTQLAPNQTHVSYQVEVDIGGSIPGWIASMIARDLPVKTLSRLRARTESQVAAAPADTLTEPGTAGGESLAQQPNAGT